MPKASDYSKALIYKIEHLDKPDLIYVGSTTNLVKRKSLHKNCCNNEKDKEYNCKKYVMMRENGGWESFKMVVIKEYPCNTKIELQIEEEKCRKELQANLNNRRCHRTEEDIKEQNKELCKNYREENKEKISDQRKDFYQNNKEKIAERGKEYRDKNKEEISEKRKEKITCDCGSTFRIRAKTRHEKSVKHQNFINRAD